MNFTNLLIALIAGLYLSGCATGPRDLVLDPVGPPPGPKPAASSDGSLVVYSAFEIYPNFNSTDPDRRQHTNYRIQTADGTLFRSVRNDTETILEGPVEVLLPVGRYRVVARANGYGWVTVPVVISAHQVTTLHLEAGGSWMKSSVPDAGRDVRLPNGLVVGWRALE